MLKESIEQLEKRLNAFDRKYETDSNLSQRLKKAERKYSVPVENIVFTI
jgi:hypothetical protein